MVHPTDLAEWESLIDENTRFLYGEMPSNPCLGFFDLRSVADLAHKYGIPLPSVVHMPHTSPNHECLLDCRLDENLVAEVAAIRDELRRLAQGISLTGGRP